MSRYAPRSSVSRFDEVQVEAAAFARGASAALKASAVAQPAFALADAGGGPAAGYLEGSATGSPFLNLQPSLGLTQVMPLSGVFPARDGGGFDGFQLGHVRTTAANFSFAEATASGQILNIAQNTALFSLFGTTYGGNGQTTFALPNLVGSAAVGTGQGPGLTEHLLGERFGSAYSTLTTSQMPSAAGGGGQPFDNQQPSLGLSWIIDVFGTYPTTSGGGGANMMGTLTQWAGTFEPAGYMYADGRSLLIDEWSTLFTLIGTTYGGDGQTTFNLPDLRGRTPVGADFNTPVGTVTGFETTTLTTANLPAGVGGQGTAVSNLQPTLAVTYLIATQGLFPSQNSSADGESVYLGEIIAFAGGFVPRGFAQASGQLLPINQNQALFSLLGTTYGGNGTTTFALPNLNDRAVIGTGNHALLGNVQIGQQIGSTDITLLASNVINTAPDILNLQATDTGTEQVYARLDEAVDIRDFNLDARNGGNGDYAGATLALSRAVSANTQDAFRIDASGAPFTVVGTDASGQLQSGGLTFATYAYANGVLTIDFTSSGATATSALVDAVASRIAYANQSDTPPASVSLSYTFRDGNTGSQGAGGQGVHIGSSLVSLTAVDDPAVAQNDAVQGGETVVLNGNVFAENGSGADSDPDSSLTVIAVNGVVASVGNQITLASGALLTVNADGTFSYVPPATDAGLPGPASGASNRTRGDTFTYSLTGGGTATVSVTVSGEDTDGDILIGAAGDDVLDGGTGTDTVDYSDAVAAVKAQLNDDIAAYDGGGGRDTLINIENLTGSAFDDVLIGSNGVNVLTGGQGRDTLIGLGGNDILVGGAGAANTLQGGLGDDTYVIVQNDTITEFAGEGTDTVEVDMASYVLRTHLENLTYVGTSSFIASGNNVANVITGGSQNDILQGLAGDDTLVGRGGYDILSGGGDSDTASYATAAAGVSVRLAVNATLNDGDGSNDRLDSIENVTGSAFGDLLFGDGNANVLNGGLGADTLLGLGGNDTLIGGAGAANTLQGGLGDDTYVVTANDTITELAGQGTDTVQTDRAFFTLGANLENLTYTGSGVFQGTGNALANLITGGAQNDTLIGGQGNDTLNGGAGTADYIVLQGTAAQYTVTDLGGGSYQIVDSVGGRDGTDTTTGVERVRFASGPTASLASLVVAPSPLAPVDKDADGPQVLPAVTDDDFLVAKNGDMPEVLPGAAEVDVSILDRAPVLPFSPGHMLTLGPDGVPTTVTADLGGRHDHDGWMF